MESKHNIYCHKKTRRKKAIERLEPNFLCRAIISKEQVQQQETTNLIDKLFDGSSEMFLSAYLSGRKLSNDEIKRLRQLIDDLE